MRARLWGNTIHMKVLLFGTGDYYNRYKKWFEHLEVLALLDNSEQKQYTVVDGLKVLPPAEGVGLKYDVIVILSFYVKQMRQQLISLGVIPEKIYHFYDLHELFGQSVVRRTVQYYLGARELVADVSPTVPKILLLSHDLTMGGPAIALFHAAGVLKKRGYRVVFAAMSGGPLLNELIKREIPVVVDENLQITTMKETGWISAFALLICNTLNFHVFLSERDTRIPVIWWLHDARFFYDGVNKEVIRKICSRNLKMMSVGPVPADAIKEFLPDRVCGELLYGVADTSGKGLTVKENKICFITIGFLEDIKGQDVLVDAVRRLPDQVRSQCIFYIVGYDKTLFGERIHRDSAGIGEIRFTGSVERQEIHRLLESADALICPSRQDSMPTVAAEAMMHSVPCILSDATGTSAYVQDEKDGLTFPAGDSRALTDKIEWCVRNRMRLGSMGNNARKLYEKYFSMHAFEKRFMEVVSEAMERQ